MVVTGRRKGEAEPARSREPIVLDGECRRVCAATAFTDTHHSLGRSPLSRFGFPKRYEEAGTFTLLDLTGNRPCGAESMAGRWSWWWWSWWSCRGGNGVAVVTVIVGGVVLVVCCCWWWWRATASGGGVVWCGGESSEWLCLWLLCGTGSGMQLMVDNSTAGS
eukprot:7380256-Prymnesium_polylepis.1